MKESPAAVFVPSKPNIAKFSNYLVLIHGEIDAARPFAITGRYKSDIGRESGI
jgi:hypothetical protein